MARNFLGESPGLSVDGEQTGAKWLTVDSSEFESILTQTENTAQKCFDKIDSLLGTLYNDVNDPSGFIAPADIDIALNKTNRTVTLTR
jgi:hypothetical protein